jgi:osmoprotectant transport system permease protein
MDAFTLVGHWFGDPAHWSGPDGVPTRLLEHLQYSGLAMLVALVIGLPTGALIGHTGRGGLALVGVANALRALPTLGILTIGVLIALTVTGRIGITPSVVVLALLGIPPVMAGAYAGIRAVDPMVVDAARGVGMRGWQVLWRVEIPNAMPLIFGGIRSAALQVISTATVVAFVALGGLGQYLKDGFAVSDYGQVISGALLVTALAIVVELLLAVVQHFVVSPGLRPARIRRRRPARAAAPVAT